ncbi:methyl-accepting chemotaxis protein [Niallia nealsonii]|uniref:Methyl-accepting chemotaxis protein n=1 Tax=Niallia nealsonii TaxID=115979 RepID=A0A2N0YXD4_9BACI|nr:methyl-accepting chemotaxis protein [Niallia nealsonii]PKG21926.1 hypothetical protein CWS01_19845 [Niallia nealsonii]
MKKSKVPNKNLLQLSIRKRLLLFIISLLLLTIFSITYVAVTKSKDLAVELMHQRLAKETKTTYIMSQNLMFTYVDDQEKFQKKIEQVVHSQDADFLKDNIQGQFYLVTNQEVKSFRVNKNEASQLPDNIVKEMRKKETGIMEKEIGKKKYSIAFMKIQELKGIYVIAVPQDDYLQEVKAISEIIVLVSGISMSVTILIIFLIVRGIVKPLNDLCYMMSEVSKGNLGVEVASNTSIPEIQSLIQSYQTMIDKIRRVLTQLQSSSGDLTKTGYMLQEHSNMMIEKNEFLTNMIAVVKKGAHETAVCSDSAIDVFQEMKQTTKQVSASMHEMNGKTKTMNECAHIGEMKIKELFQSLNVLHLDVREMAATIGQVKEQSMSIGDIIFSIRKLADKTKLVALNASIEAARAGENGKGFAIVADEVRNLANSSKKATEEINAFTKEMDKIAERASAEMVQITNKFMECSQTSEESSTSFNQLLQGIEIVNKELAVNQEKLKELQTFLPIMENSSLQLAAISQQTLANADEMKEIADMHKEGLQTNAKVNKKLAELAQTIKAVSNEFLT